MNPTRRDPVCGRPKGIVVGRRAVDVVLRRRTRVVQGEPFLGLLDAVVKEFVVQLKRLQRSQQVAPDIFGKLAGMDGDVDQGAHEPFLAENNRQDKGSLRLLRPLT